MQKYYYKNSIVFFSHYKFTPDQIESLLLWDEINLMASIFLFSGACLLKYLGTSEIIAVLLSLIAFVSGAVFFGVQRDRIKNSFIRILQEHKRFEMKRQKKQLVSSFYRVCIGFCSSGLATCSYRL